MPRRIPDDVKEEAARMLQRGGMTQRQIASELGISQSSVSRINQERDYWLSSGSCSRVSSSPPFEPPPLRFASPAPAPSVCWANQRPIVVDNSQQLRKELADKDLKIAELKSEVDKLSEIIRKNNLTIERLLIEDENHKDYDELKKENEELKKKNEKLNKDNQQLERNCSDLKESYLELKNRCSYLEKENQQLERNCSDLKENTLESKNKCSYLEKANLLLNKEKQSLVVENEKLRKDCERTERKLEIKENQLENLQEKLLNLDERTNHEKCEIM